MTVLRSLSAILLACAFILTLGGCEAPRGDKEVKTEPQEGRSDGPGLFTGKKGGIVIYEEVWTGSSPSGDIAE